MGVIKIKKIEHATTNLNPELAASASVETLIDW